MWSKPASNCRSSASASGDLPSSSFDIKVQDFKFFFIYFNFNFVSFWCRIKDEFNAINIIWFNSKHLIGYVLKYRSVLHSKINFVYGVMLGTINS